MANRLVKKLTDLVRGNNNNRHPYVGKKSWLRYVISGTFPRPQDLNRSSVLHDIESKINTMRALATDSQISTALSYYATDSTVANSSGQIIWATSEVKEVADAINSLFKSMRINNYIRDHILELATIGNLYIPTTDFYRSNESRRVGVALDNNTIIDDDFGIIPAYKIAPERTLHLWYQGEPQGFLHQYSDDDNNVINLPESAIIHFSLGGLLGDYDIQMQSDDGGLIDYDVQFAEPLLLSALAPTQALGNLEDAMLLASFVRVVKFINVDCSGDEEDKIRADLLAVKEAIENQMSINTATGDSQSFMNPQSPNNLIYLPKVNGQDPISITDLNMAENTESDIKLLDYYQNKKLSVLGIPKEAMNYSSNEGLGAAGTVMSQRSALYANILDRLMTAYKTGWTDGFNKYFMAHGMSSFVNKFELHMNPIITTQSTINFDKRDAALNQASTLVTLFRDMGVSDPKAYAEALVEILAEVFPKMGADMSGIEMDITGGDNGAL